jgi:hypothetical protein
MTRSLNLQLVDDPPMADVGIEAPAPPDPPKVFSRQISTPAGAPWDQARAADLDARHWAPLPLSEVVYQVRRLDGWKPGAPGHHVAFYIRAADVGESFETDLWIEGRRVGVRFLSPAERGRRARRLALIGAASAAAILILGVAVTTVVSVRQATSDQVELVEANAASTLAAARSAEQAQREDAALTEAGMQGRSIDAFLQDIAWASSAKTPDARVDALHWDSGYMALEVHGQATPPFTRFDRPLKQSDKVLAHGVRLWLIGPAEPQR